MDTYIILSLKLPLMAVKVPVIVIVLFLHKLLYKWMFADMRKNTKDRNTNVGNTLAHMDTKRTVYTYYGST